MQYSLSELKKKCVINICDGKKLGKITDVTIEFPGNCIHDFTISPQVNLFCGEQLKISPCEIERIGQDAILIRPKQQKRNCEIEE